MTTFCINFYESYPSTKRTELTTLKVAWSIEVQSPYSDEKGLKLHGKISSCYTLGLGYSGGPSAFTVEQAQIGIWLSRGLALGSFTVKFKY